MSEKTPIYAMDVFKSTGTVDLDINKKCYENVEFSDALEVGDTCYDCEFCETDPVGIIGGMTGKVAAERRICEKGYWKEEW